MASPSSTCSTCLRGLQRVACRSSSSPRRRFGHTARAHQRSQLTPWQQQPLYLDFLAPYSKRLPATYKVSTPRLPNRSAARTITTASASAASDPEPPQSPPQRVARAILNPRTDADGKPMYIAISPRATNRLASICAKDNNPDQALRVTIESGGCHGFQYLMNLVDLSKTPPAEDDTVFEGEKGAKVVIDEASLELLNGSTVDYTMELIGSQFKITGIPGATSSCGCGTSFDIKI